MALRAPIVPITLRAPRAGASRGSCSVSPICVSPQMYVNAMKSGSGARVGFRHCSGSSFLDQFIDVNVMVLGMFLAFDFWPQLICDGYVNVPELRFLRCDCPAMLA